MSTGSARAIAATAVCLLAVLAAISGSAAAQVSEDGRLPRTQFVKGRIATDGVFTPFAPETLEIRKLPSRMKFQIMVGPPPAAGNCNTAYACEPTQVRRLPGTPRFRTSGQGRAEVAFPAPHGYLRFNTLNPKSPPDFVTFGDGNPLFIVLAGGKIRQRGDRVKVIIAQAVARGSVAF